MTAISSINIREQLSGVRILVAFKDTFSGRWFCNMAYFSVKASCPEAYPPCLYSMVRVPSPNDAKNKNKRLSLLRE